MYTADEWPIACKASFGPVAEDGTPIIEAGPKVWYDQLLQMAELGFTCIDPMDDWLPMADLTEDQLRTYTELLADTGLRTAAISIGRNSVVDVEHGERNLQTIHRTIDRAAELGATVVNIGFQQALTQAQKDALWFWLAEGHHDDWSLRDLAIERVRDLADHAQRLGLQISPDPRPSRLRHPLDHSRSRFGGKSSRLLPHDAGRSPLCSGYPIGLARSSRSAWC